MNSSGTGWAVTVVLAAAMGLASCSSDMETPVRPYTPDVAEVDPAAGAPVRLSASDQPPAPTLATDAMVGQVRGNAIYANTVFRRIGTQLELQGQSLSRAAFRDEARRSIYGELDYLVFNAALLGEAERDLNDQERLYLDQMVQMQREELVRLKGMGSPVAADVVIRQEREANGREGGLEAELTEFRQTRVLQWYMSQKVYPRINVSRKDIDRYYQNNISKYMPQPNRTVRVINVKSVTDADEVDQLLAAGTPFAEVAAKKINRFHDDPLLRISVGEQGFRYDQLNEAAKDLKINQHTPRITVETPGGRGQEYYWISLESIETGKGKTLQEVQQEISAYLHNIAIQNWQRRFKEELANTESYRALPRMTDILVEVAMVRYARPE